MCKRKEDDQIQNSRNACIEEVEKGSGVRRDPRGLYGDREACRGSDLEGR